MNDQIFADGIGSISIIGATVRIDFVRYSATKLDEKGQPQPEFLNRVIMGIDGFVRSSGKIQETIQALYKMGAIQKTPLAATEGVAEHRASSGANGAATKNDPAVIREEQAKAPFP